MQLHAILIGNVNYFIILINFILGMFHRPIPEFITFLTTGSNFVDITTAPIRPLHESWLLHATMFKFPVSGECEVSDISGSFAN